MGLGLGCALVWYVWCGALHFTSIRVPRKVVAPNAGGEVIVMSYHVGLGM